ncbi:hypothetical protein FOB92_00525 [Streptococcus mitis]|nr:hypothetical protein FOB92_00525 [Streptococcus mitis]
MFQDLQVVATRDNISPPPFFILYSSKTSSNHVSFHLQPQNTVLSNLRLAS